MRGISGFMGLVALFVLASVALAASPLDGTQWQIKLTNTAAKTPSEDRIRFEKGRFTSPLFQPKGFPTSNYTLTEEKDGPVIWETMQTSERSEEHTSELQSPCNLVCRLLLEKKKRWIVIHI